MSNSHETWLNSISPKRAELIREADAAVEMSRRFEYVRDVTNCAAWQKIADDLYAQAEVEA
jgi:hypothetical protein